MRSIYRNRMGYSGSKKKEISAHELCEWIESKRFK